MIVNKTVLIVGAGASHDLGLPLGSELIEKIRNLLYFDYRTHEPTKGDEKFIRAMKASEKFLEYYNAAGLIRKGITTSNSIDDYLYNHNHNDYVTLMGKAGIFLSILREERGCGNIKPLNGSISINRDNLTKTWYDKFAKMMVTRVASKSIDSIFTNVSVINFNYDRTLEQFLAYYLTDAYNIDISRASSIIDNLKIIRPYGSIGKWTSMSTTEEYLPFGAEVHWRELFNYAKRIRTYHEQIGENSIVEDIKLELQNAEIIVFLGFGYHEQNMEILKCHVKKNVKYIFGTSLGISDHNCNVIIDNLCSKFSIQRNMRGRIILRNDLSCFGFLEEYSRSLYS